MPPTCNQRLLNEATLLGTELILQQLPAEYSPALEEAIRQSVRLALLHYAHGLDTLSRHLRPLDQAKARA
jgi:predicted solute-binding protein